MAIGVTREPVGPRRVLAAAYLLFVVAAGSRSAVQLATDLDRAPLAYTLSAVAAVVYLVNLVLVARDASRGLLTIFASVELAGVLVVGTAGLLAPEGFPDATVWSGFGIGYALVPLAPPVLVLVWVHNRAT